MAGTPQKGSKTGSSKSNTGTSVVLRCGEGGGQGEGGDWEGGLSQRPQGGGSGGGT